MPGKGKQEDRHAVPPSIRAADKEQEQAKDRNGKTADLPVTVEGCQVIGDGGGLGVGDQAQGESRRHQQADQRRRRARCAAGLGERPQPDHPDESQEREGGRSTGGRNSERLMNPSLPSALRMKSATCAESRKLNPKTVRRACGNPLARRWKTAD
ncbi:MAG: hypothetical protein MZV64_59785 [Ignavibacteriales bacterium]|nr:hypothetical protein [Ignavibacteriales bacterium]